jgi:hypothetical protein
MQQRSFWLNLIALLALVSAQVLGSAVASSRHTTCKMACCAAKQAKVETASRSCHRKTEAVPVSEHCKAILAAKASKQVSSGKKGCSCEIRSGNPRELPVGVLTNGLSFSTIEIEAVLPPTSVSFAEKSVSGVQPGIVGSDSGPPTSRPHCVWFGRAPPVVAGSLARLS